MITKNSKKKKHSLSSKKFRSARIFRINNEAAELQRVTTAAWSFAVASLWGSQQFSEAETVAAKLQIGATFLNVPNKYDCLHEFCQRILLAKKFIIPAFGETLPVPSIWFDYNNSNGYEATKILFNELTKQRNSEPASLSELNHVADAVVKFTKSLQH